MSGGSKKNVSASVHQQLLNICRVRKDDFNRICVRYAAERLLYRISVSEYSNRFILKGAMLFAVWSDSPHRTTRDIDLLAYGAPEPDQFRILFESFCSQSAQDDGLRFDPKTIQINAIREADVYKGFRVRMNAYLGSAKIPVQIDIGFGDVVTPEAQAIEYPTILDFPAPSLKAYPPETVIAEKFHTLVKLGMANSRMKDFYDVVFLAQTYSFKRKILSKAIRQTFMNRKTAIEIDDLFWEKLKADSLKQQQWNAFLTRHHLSLYHKFSEVMIRLEKFVVPVCAVNEENGKNAIWNPEIWKWE